jgi:SAM-dependent methyltransferase
MYKTIKRFISSILSKEFIFKHEPKFRLAFSLAYTGDNFTCRICNKDLRKFIELDNGNRICALCGSSDRDRKLWDLINQKYLKPGISILDFSPSRSIYRAFKNIPNIVYISTDLSGDFISDQSYDITNIDTSTDHFDLILCYHILEHVEHDQQAMTELYRVLKPSGICLIQTPFKDGEIYENPTITTEEGRLKHFGQEDHVRIYSVSGLKERLQESGFQVEVLNTSEKPDNRYGFKTNETILVCSKS